MNSFYQKKCSNHHLIDIRLGAYQKFSYYLLCIENKLFTDSLLSSIELDRTRLMELELDSNSIIPSSNSIELETRYSSWSRVRVYIFELEPRLRVELDIIEFKRFGFGTYLQLNIRLSTKFCRFFLKSCRIT